MKKNQTIVLTPPYVIGPRINYYMNSLLIGTGANCT